MRKAEEKDLKKIMEIIEDGKISLREDGIDQWQKGEPSIVDIRKDLERDEAYVYTLNGEIVAYAFLKEEYEEDYRPIEENFLIHDEFLTVHRLSVSRSMKRKGIAGKFVDDIIDFSKKKGLKAIRVDTHENNFKIKKFVQKLGFSQRGICFVDDGDRRSKRIAYELVL